MQNLHSPHNNEQCICSNPEQLENASLIDSAHMFRQFATDIDNVRKYIKAAAKEAVETTLKYRDARTASDVEKCLQRFMSDFESSVKELCSDIDDKIVLADRDKCPYCKK